MMKSNIGKEVGLPLDFQFLLFMKAGQVGVHSINSSVGVVVIYLSNNFVCKIERYQY